LKQWCFVFLSLFSTVLSGLSVAAQADGLPSVLAFEGGNDTLGSRDYYLDLDFAFVNQSRLLVAMARNYSTHQNNPITTRSILLGFRTDPLERFSIGVDLESWGKKGFLETGTLRAIMDINLQQWQFSLRPQWRRLAYFARRCARSECRREVKSTGTAFDVSYYTNGPWSFSMGFARYQYNEKVERLGQGRVFPRRLSATTLNFSTELEDYRRSVAVFYYSDDLLWGYSWLKSVSKITGEASFVHTLRFSTDLSEQWRLHLRVGNQTLENSGKSVKFAGTGLAYSW